MLFETCANRVLFRLGLSSYPNCDRCCACQPCETSFGHPQSCRGKCPAFCAIGERCVQHSGAGRASFTAGGGSGIKGAVVRRTLCPGRCASSAGVYLFVCHGSRHFLVFALEAAERCSNDPVFNFAREPHGLLWTEIACAWKRTRTHHFPDCWKRETDTLKHFALDHNLMSGPRSGGNGAGIGGFIFIAGSEAFCSWQPYLWLLSEERERKAKSTRRDLTRWVPYDACQSREYFTPRMSEVRPAYRDFFGCDACGDRACSPLRAACFNTATFLRNILKVSNTRLKACSYLLNATRLPIAGWPVTSAIRCAATASMTR